MKCIKKFLSAVALQVISMNLSAADLSVGIFPTSFPRDPVEVNVFLEHILLGQILEPLVEAGPDGTVIPGASSRWQFSPDGRTLHFFFDEKSRFSNGQRLSAEDAKYTLDRHIQSSSQSKSYLKRIESLQIISPTELVLKFKEPYVAILKALSRDHLGIVPKGWKFDAASHEPFIGSGAYRAIKENDGWVLVKNSHYRKAANVEIERWKVVFAAPKGQESNQQIPDLMPFVFEETLQQLRPLTNWDKSRLLEEDVTHFFQSSAWWYPHGTTYKDAKRQKLGMCVINELIALRVRELGLHRASGLIPQGIAGHLSKSPAVSCNATELASVANRGFSITVIAREMPMVNHAPTLKAVEAKFGVKLKLSSVEPHDMKSLVASKPDIFLLAFAGGFQDPEGFLTVITGMLATELPDIFQSDYDTYLEASSQGDWEKRTALYKTINGNLTRNFRMAPGWRARAKRVRCKDVVLGVGDLRYSPKLGDFKLRKEKP